MAAARQSREQNITVFDEPLQKIVCVMQGDEFFSTWVANKAVYRTRMALADGGELIIIAPGLKRFGEQPEVDAFIRKYGYVGTPRVMEQYTQERRHAGSGPRHGPPDPRIERRPLHRSPTPPAICSKREIEGVNFRYADINETIARYRPDKSQTGLEHDGRRRAVLLHPHALGRPVGDAREALQPRERLCRDGVNAAGLSWSHRLKALSVCATTSRRFGGVWRAGKHVESMAPDDLRRWLRLFACDRFEEVDDFWGVSVVFWRKQSDRVTIWHGCYTARTAIGRAGWARFHRA